MGSYITMYAMEELLDMARNDVVHHIPKYPILPYRVDRIVSYGEYAAFYTRSFAVRWKLKNDHKSGFWYPLLNEQDMDNSIESFLGYKPWDFSLMLDDSEGWHSGGEFKGVYDVMRLFVFTNNDVKGSIRLSQDDIRLAGLFFDSPKEIVLSTTRHGCGKAMPIRISSPSNPNVDVVVKQAY